MVLSDRRLNRALDRTKIKRLNTTDTLPLKSEKSQIKDSDRSARDQKDCEAQNGAERAFGPRGPYSVLSSQMIKPQKPRSLFLSRDLRGIPCVRPSFLNPGEWRQSPGPSSADYPYCPTENRFDFPTPAADALACPVKYRQSHPERGFLCRLW